MASSQALRDVATLMLQTGMRPEEVCRIRRKNVDLDQDYLFNPHGKTSAAKRRIPLNRTAKEVMSRRLEQDGDYLFKGRVEGRPIVKVNAAHTAAVDRSGCVTLRCMHCDIRMRHERQWQESMPSLWPHCLVIPRLLW